MTRTRRGNTIVLVVGVLVLLVIIATSFVTRTHAGRVTSTAQTRASLRDDNADVIARSIAAEIAESLFVRPMDPTLAPAAANDSNLVRGPIQLDAVRYGVDQARLNNGPDGIVNTADDVLRFPFNFAPYQVIPWTNWPDGIARADVPEGPGNPNGGTVSTNLRMDGNPLGNPGIGDTQWLASFEPLRWDGIIDPPPNLPRLDAFSHWPHLSYIARPNNGYLLCRDISTTNVLTVHGIPVEQWLPLRPPGLYGVTGSPDIGTYPDALAFINHWARWFDTDYFDLYWNTAAPPDGPPSNLWDLSDLDADGIPGEAIPGERSEDEFVPGTARWSVGRVLADADGDGFTDSYWFLVPSTIEGGIRQIVAVRIVDNCAMLNVNAATQFVANDPNPANPLAFRTASWGAGPCDLALAGDLHDPAYYTWAAGDPVHPLAVGFFDCPQHAESMFPAGGNPYGLTTVAWNPDRWFASTDGPYAFLPQLGIDDQFLFPTLLHDARERLLYWQLSGRNPQGAKLGLTPFDLADEIELRMFHGNNYPWVMSRFERATNTIAMDFALLHSTNDQALNPPQIRQESSEYLDQLFNRELMFESRHRLTTYSAARNDLMPPWLWPSLFPLDLNGDGTIDVPEHRQFLAGMRKLDLRRPVFNGFNVVAPDVDRDGVVEPVVPGSRWDDDVNDDNFVDEGDHYHLVADRILRALTDGNEASGRGYFGPYTSAAEFMDLRRAAAGLAANIVQHRDANATYRQMTDTPPPAPPMRKLIEAVSLPGMGSVPVDHDRRMLGLEPQPFLTEVMIGHLYETQNVPPGYLNSGDTIVRASYPHTSVVVVQIANPFDRPVDLTGFELSVFGKLVSVGTVNNYLLPDEARTCYAIDGIFANGTAFIDSLGLDALGDRLDVGWPTDRDTSGMYDDGDPLRAVELVRRIDGEPVVVDRIDQPVLAPGMFGQQVVGLAEPNNDPIPPPDPAVNHPGTPADTGDTHWLQWVHGNRAWWVDTDTDGTLDPAERNPRFVFSDRDVVSGSDSFSILGGGSGLTMIDYFDTTQKDCATCTAQNPRNHSLQMLAKGGAAGTLGPLSIPNYPDEHEGFVQLGELLDVWMFGHELDFGGGTYLGTRTTFSEFMGAPKLTGEDERVNRLRPDPVTVQGAEIGMVVGAELGDPPTSPPDFTDRRHAAPALPAGLRVFEAFVCDGAAPSNQLYGLAQEFTGRGTSGLVNVSTAPPEVLRAAPHMTRIVRQNVPPDQNPFVRVAEAIVQYRERGNGLNPIANPSATGTPGGPDYSDRGDLGGLHPGMRQERGLASIGELLLLERDRASASADPLEPKENWRIDFAARVSPFAGTGGTDLSTDVTDAFDELAGRYVPDLVSADAEEENLLFAGVSNMLTTRSDTFTVYMKIRSFRQNPVTLAWDATDPEHIIDDSRYVMLVDRSEVDSPAQKPKILYFEKLPK